MTLKQELIRYSKKCIKDKTHICQKHRWACMRFLRDIEKAGTKKFPYIFDEERAERFFAWAAMHKHTKGILAGQPIIFEPIRRFILGISMDGSVKIRGFGVLKKHIGRSGGRMRNHNHSP